MVLISIVLAAAHAAARLDSYHQEPGLERTESRAQWGQWGQWGHMGTTNDFEQKITKVTKNNGGKNLVGSAMNLGCRGAFTKIELTADFTDDTDKEKDSEQRSTEEISEEMRGVSSVLGTDFTGSDDSFSSSVTLKRQFAHSCEDFFFVIFVIFVTFCSKSFSLSVSIREIRGQFYFNCSDAPGSPCGISGKIFPVLCYLF
jgi:hypothetical protein